jgi:glutathione S-transferase
MLELYQFELSPYSEKVRLILDYKGLEYQKIEVTPGVGQVEIYRISGQKQLPVLKDGSTIIADSTEIALYLDRKYPDKPLLPSDPIARSQCLILEEWADESLAKKAKLPFLDYLRQDASLRSVILPSQTPDFVKTLLSSVPGEFFEFLGSGIGINRELISSASKKLRDALENLSIILSSRSFLVGDQLTLADLTVAALTIPIKFPDGKYMDIPAQLRGKGIPGIADDPTYANFFLWRDAIYSQYRKTSNIPETNRATSPSSIEIE